MFFRIIRDPITCFLIIVCCTLPLTGCMGGKTAGAMTDQQETWMRCDSGWVSWSSNYSCRANIDGKTYVGPGVLLEDSSATFDSVFGENSSSQESILGAGRKMKVVLIDKRADSFMRCLVTWTEPIFHLFESDAECVHSDGRKFNFAW